MSINHYWISGKTT